MSLGEQKCARCEQSTTSTRMSRFNTEMCCDGCIKKEKAHPQYAAAAAEELRQCRMGNYNFEGIGKPEDL